MTRTDEHNTDIPREASRRDFLRTAGQAGVAIAAATTFIVAEAPPAGATQGSWLWCYQCQGLWFSGNPTNGYCPVGSGFLGLNHSHQRAGSCNYNLKFSSDGGRGDDRWRWCRFCQGLWKSSGGVVGPGNFCLNSPDRKHSVAGSGVYRIEFLPNDVDRSGGQNRWRACEKCGGLFFKDNGPGVCPAGNGHAEDLFIPPLEGVDYLLRDIPWST